MKSLLYPAVVLATGVALVLPSACTTESYCFTCETEPGQDAAPDKADTAAPESGTGGTGGGVLIDGGGGATGETGADAAPEACGDTQSDPKNCGTCGHVCELFAAFPKCVNGACAIDSCADGHYDHNQLTSDGCEYACTPTGAELCDTKDNDCDGDIDEGFDLQTDKNNCGSCGTACNPPHGTGACQVVQGAPRCVVASCEDGYGDANKLAADGCEYTCPVWPLEAEACNDKDDNCDGQLNENNPGGGQPCETNCPNGSCTGECTPGTTVCSGTNIICVGGQGPTLEACDGKDNNCDGQVDEGFDVLSDPVNCGTCGIVCWAPNAIAGCGNGSCVVSVCLPGFGDLDKDASNGCEYVFPVNPPTVETCNGLDDDGNGIVDDASAIAAQKPPAAGCYPKPGSPCAGADFVCKGSLGWRCEYAAGVETDTAGKLVLVETRCDGIDGNCNGQVDEAFTDKGTGCDNGLLGACRDVGVRICDPNDVTKTVCDLSQAPDPVPGAPHAETCNGVDDDCNGLADDGIVDDMVQVTSSGVTFYVDRYEASRPDATATSPGLMESRRCVNAGVLPWTHTNQAEAAAACAATGARLCTATELQAACAGAASNAYPYGAAYGATTCNGLDFDGVPGGANDDVLLATGGSLTSGCSTPTGIYDLSGNAAEWTSTVTGNTGPPQNLVIYMAKGGSYKSPALGLTCQFTLSRYASNAILPELGFRCCRD